jgi:hypothetical protein
MSKGEGIVVYCNHGNVMFSSTGELIQSKQSVRKHRVNKSIIYKEYQDMRELEKDEFWRDLLNKFSKNNFLKDFKYINNVLYYKPNTKKNRDELLIDKEDCFTSLEKFKDFMRNKGYISPSERLELNKIIENNIEEILVIETWKDILRNKDYHVKNYIIDLKEKYNLSRKERDNLESTVMIGIASEFFNEDNIVIKEEKIFNIENLLWDEEKRLFSIKTSDYKIKKKSDKVDNKKIFTSYTVETSNDNYVLVFKEAKDMAIEKKWLKFLESISSIKEL